MSVEFTEPPEEIEIILTPEGTQIFEICNTCLFEEGADENCKPSALLFVQELRKQGHVAEIREPKEDPCFT